MPALARLALLFALPPAVLLVLSLYGEHGLFFWDAKTLPCGLQAFLDTGNPNAYHRNPAHPGPCAGDGYEYMLPPAATALLAPLFRGLGPTLAAILYGLAYLAAWAVLLNGARQAGGRPRDIAALTLLAAAGVFLFEFGSGNLTIAVLGGLFALVSGDLARPGRATLVCALCAAAALLKPQFALYLLVPLFAGEAWLAAAAGLAAATLGYALDALRDGAAFDRWIALVLGVVRGEPHFGVLRGLELAGVDGRNWLGQGLAYAGWSALVLGGLWRLRPRLPDAHDRAMAALLAATLLQPRLKEYDLVVLIPLVFWVLARLPEGRRIPAQSALLVGLGILPTLGWGLAKLGQDAPRTLTQWADPGWLIGHQGIFLAATALLLWVALLWPAPSVRPYPHSS